MPLFLLVFFSKDIFLGKIILTGSNVRLVNSMLALKAFSKMENFVKISNRNKDFLFAIILFRLILTTVTMIFCAAKTRINSDSLSPFSSVVRGFINRTKESRLKNGADQKCETVAPQN